MSDLRYKPCERCADARAKWDPQARRCNSCRGTGFVLESYVCNCCGETIVVEMNVLGLSDGAVQGSYESRWLFDCTTYKFSLCEKCLRELFERMKVPPVLSDYMDGTDGSYADDRAFYLERLSKGLLT